MLTIRLSRVGRKNDPSFRVIVVEKQRKPQPGNYLEMLGSYNPKMDRVELNADRIKYWMGQGATVSDTVHNLLVSKKVIDAKKINILPSYKAPAAEAAPVSAPSTEGTEAPSEVQEEAPAEAPAEEPEAVTNDVAADAPKE